MKLNSSAKIFSWYYYIVIVIILLVGVFSSILTYQEVSKSTKEELLKNTSSIASVFETDHIASFSGDESDLKNPQYIALKNKLEKIPQINNEIRFVYLWGYRGDKVYFIVDSEPENSADYSPPGQIYDEATDIDYAMFLQKLPSSIEMNTDRWGTWLSALVPMKDPLTGDLVAVMGMDMSADKYFRTVYIYTAIPALATIFVLLLFIVGFILRKREQEFITFKSELVAIASHEIRSPLTGISWLTAGILKQGDNLSGSQKEDINIIKKKTEDLLSAVNDLLEGTVAEKINKKKLVKKVIFVKALFEEIKENSSLILAEKNNQLIIDDSITSAMSILGDEDRIRRMFVNLISNAIKYSKNEGIVTLSVMEQGNKFIFSVQDAGIGIPVEDQKKIFRGFFRSENAKKITENGTGLGLHFVRQIAELHDGYVWCESKEGEGSTFYIELPKN